MAEKLSGLKDMSMTAVTDAGAQLRSKLPRLTDLLPAGPPGAYARKLEGDPADSAGKP